VTYDEALAYLDAHIDLERSAAIAGSVEGLKLERIAALCHALGDPHRASPVIHLTGTNGKGSTARMITALVAASGLSVGAYTSPHLERINERLVSASDPAHVVPIDDRSFAEAIATVADAELVARVDPSYFELLTAAAFHWFAGLPVDVTVLEVGLLGRWDATNVADAAVAVLTNIGKDHTDGIGDWRRRVAEEKSGIVKPASTFVLGEADRELRGVFEAAGAARLWVRGEDFACERTEVAVGGRTLDVRTPGGRIDGVYLPVHGAHQAENAALAITALEALVDRTPDADVVADAFAHLELPCRFEVVHRGPLVVLDGAHNPDGARVVSRTLGEEFAVDGRRHVVLGLLTGRDPIEMATALGLDSHDDVLTTTPASPRAVPAAALAGQLAAAGLRATPVDDVGDALRTAVDASAPEDLVLVTGSLYTVGDARRTCRDLGFLPLQPRG
jgi:dihydrofolate synthase/folylpolyglutamate synthase